MLNSLLLFLLMVKYIPFASTANGINNFHFLGSNMLYGTKLPQNVEISGTYYLNTENEEIAKLSNSQFFANGIIKSGNATFSINQLRGAGPWMCTKNTVNLIAMINEQNHLVTERNLVLMNSAVVDRGNRNLKKLLDFSLDFETMKPYLPIDGCTSMAQYLKPFNNISFVGVEYENKVFSFEFEHKFTEFSPILFIDYMGSGAFHYKQKLKNANSLKDKGHPLRYCDGVTYGSSMYTLEARPVCPHESADRRIHEKGVIVVYKPNIVPITRKITRCSKGRTLVHAGRTFCCFAEKYDNRPLVTIKTATTYQECADMQATLKSPFGDLKPTLEGNGTFSAFSTANNKDFDYGSWWEHGTSQNKNVTDMFMEHSVMKVEMPSMNILTPWLSVPRSFLYKNTYQGAESRIIWEPFEKEEICLYVPRMTTEVNAVHYPDNDQLSEESTSAGADKTTYFVSETVKGVWSVDDSMVFVNTKKFNCIRKESSDKLYMTKTGDIIKWSPGKTLHPKSMPSPENIGTTSIHHAHTSYVEITHAGNGVVTAVQNKHTLGHDKSDNSTIKMKNKVIAKPPPPIMPSSPPSGVPNPVAVTWQDAIAFINFKTVEQENENVHKRSIANCESSQLEWDMFHQLLDISPSVAIGGRLREVVQATHGGNGFYNVKKCEMVFDTTVIPTMFTNSTSTIMLNGNKISIREISAALGVIPSENKCYSYPLVKFRLGGFNLEKIGQMNRDGRIDSIKAKHLEYCRTSSMFVFNINNATSFFKDYRLHATIPTASVMSRVGTFETAQAALKTGRNVAIMDPLTEFISKIHIIPMTEPLIEKKFKHYPTGQYVSNKYSQEEQGAAADSLLEMMMARAYSAFFNKVWRQKTIVDWTGGSIPNEKSGSLGSVIADLFTGGVNGIISVADTVVTKLGSGIGSAFTSLGDGLDDLGGGLGKGINALGSGVGSIITSIVLPVVAVVAIGVGGYFIYNKFIAKKPEDDMESEFINAKNNDKIYRGEEEEDYGYATDNLYRGAFNETLGTTKKRTQQ